MRKFVATVITVALVILSPSAYSAPRLGSGRLIVKGSGYLQLVTPEGITVVANRIRVHLTRSSQSLVSRRGGEITGVASIPRDAVDLRIARDGTITYKRPGESKLSSAGQILAIAFDHPEALDSIGNGLFQETEASGLPRAGIFGEPEFGYVVFRRKR